MGHGRAVRRRVARAVLTVLVGSASLSGLVLIAAPAHALLSNAMVTGFDANTFGANDDGSYPCTSAEQGTPPGCTPTAVSLPFSPNFYGTTYSSLYVNNNGNLTFDQPYNTYTPPPLDQLDQPMIAPFFGDVDTRVGNTVTFGTGTFDGHTAFGVNWPGVGCYNENNAALNYFQALLVDRSDVGTGDFDIVFNYDGIQWDSGQASGGGADCRGGDAARAGYTDGSSTSGESYELPGSGVNDALLDSGGLTSLVGHSYNSNQPGRYVFSFRDGLPAITATTVTTDLSDGTNDGASLSVAPGTPVTDQATLGGLRASSASGFVNYSVYDDPACTHEVADAITRAVTDGQVPPSEPVTLGVGTYYWLARYSGDAANYASTNTCGDEVETVAEPSNDISISPTAQTLHTGSDAIFTATVTHGGDPVVGDTVFFRSTGSNGTTLSQTTNDSGEAQFSYSGNNIGNDAITVCDDANNNGSCDGNDQSASATMTWYGQDISIGSASILESDSGRSSLVFPVTLREPATSTITVNYNTQDGTAIAKTDYLATKGKLTFRAGTRIKYVTVPILGDAAAQPADPDADAYFTVVLSSSVGAPITHGFGTGTIFERAPDPSNVDIAINPWVNGFDTLGGTNVVKLTVSLSRPAPGPVSVQWTTAPIAGTPLSDFVSAHGTLRFLTGQMSKTVSVKFIGDTNALISEDTDEFFVTLTSASGGVIPVGDDTALVAVQPDQV